MPAEPALALGISGPEPAWARVRQLVLDAVPSPISKAMYGRALDDFFRWWAGQGRPPFSKAAVQAHKAHLESRGYAAATVNQRLAALRKLAAEASDNGLLAQDAAGAILRVKGARRHGVRLGNWLTAPEAEALLHRPDPSQLKGVRDRALLAVLLGCGLRRGEAAQLTFAHLAVREGRPVIVDLAGKHGRVRSVPVPVWVKTALDRWAEAAGLSEGRLFRAVNRHGTITGEGISPQSILETVAGYARELGLALTAHDLRRTCAHLCRREGGELEQIQLLLGHASVQTTERYLGTRQNLAHPPNDRIPLRWHK